MNYDNMPIVIDSYKTFLDKIFLNLKEANIGLEEVKALDHLCYRAVTLKGYHHKKKEFEKVGKLADESIINGRPIALFEFNVPISYKNFTIDCIEVAAPSEEKPYPEGLEHVEFVTNRPLVIFMRKHPDLKFIKKLTEYHNDPMIVLKFKDCTIKFHEKALLEILAME